MTHLNYYLRRTLQGFRNEWTTNLATILTLSVTFVLVGALGTVAVSLGEQVERWGGADQYQVTAYLEPGASPDAAEKLRAALQGMEEVRAVRFVSEAEARRRLVESFPEEAAAWSALDNSYFTPYVEIGLDPALADEELYRALVARIGKLEIVQDVETHGDWYASVLGIHRAVRVLAIAFGLLAAFGTVVVVSHAIRLNFHRRGRQVEVLRMCGATPWFVRVPFLLEGIIGSLLAALVALGAITLFVEVLRDRLADVAPVLGSSPLEHLPFTAWLAFLGAAALIGLAGSWMSVRKAVRS